MVVLVGAVSPARGGPRESQVEQRLLILEAPGNVLTKTARERLHAAIAEAAVGQGLTLASPASLPDKLLTCDLPGCLSPIAAASGAIFVLRVDAKFAKESFKLAVELWNSDVGKLLGKERRDCPICDEQDLWGSAAFMARGLLERAVRESAPPVSVAATVAKPSPATAPAAGPVLTEVPPSSAVPVVRYSGLALSVLGLAALATGIYYWSVDGSQAGSPDWDRDTRKLGIPMTIAGGAALVAGAAMVGWSFWSGSAEASAGPSGLRVAGRF
jgi:hypothetical protein